MRRIGDDELVAKLSRGAYDAYWRDPPTLEAHVREICAVYEQALRQQSAATEPRLAQENTLVEQA